jgi:hypothetical protein
MSFRYVFILIFHKCKLRANNLRVFIILKSIFLFSFVFFFCNYDNNKNSIGGGEENDYNLLAKYFQ